MQIDKKSIQDRLRKADFTGQRLPDYDTRRRIEREVGKHCHQQPMDGVKELWAISRPSVGPAGIWMPAINNIGFERPLVEDDWTLTCLPDSTPDGQKIHFKLQGTATGDDGEGWSTERFVSRSQRAIIEPADWRVAWTLGYPKATLPDGFKVTWRSYPMFTRVYEPQPADARTLLVQGCSHQAHTLTLVPHGGDLGIRAYVVHAPAARP